MTIQPNLFGGHSLMRTWGRIGSGGQMRIELFDDINSAQKARDRLSKEKQNRGYVGVL